MDETSPLPTPRRILRLVLPALAMLAIFAADTTTSYEVAASVFYSLVILVVGNGSSRRAVLALAAACVGMTLLSFAITPAGDYRAGLVNTAISMLSITLTTWLILKMEAARATAHAAQAQLLRLARGKSLEGLTTSIAHEVNQPLAAIITSGNACQRWLAQQPPNLDKARQALDRIVDDAARAGSIIARVRSLTKGEPPQRSGFDLNEALREVIALSQGELQRSNIMLELVLDPGLPQAGADRVQIQQVVSNLVLNAIDAIGTAHSGKRSIRLVSGICQDLLRVSVIDSGSGLPEGAHEQVFEAFWTTKEDGIGVGLSISRTIVEANGGRIWAEPGQAGGAVFHFSVPVWRQEAPA